MDLGALFVDCDSFFASCEQHLRPELRGLPIGIAPVMAESSCCIAASYPAKKFGVKTGTRISEARVLCPGIQIVEARPAEYVKIHHQLVAAVEDCIHVEAVLSIDEMWAWLPLNWREAEFVESLARRIKANVAKAIGSAVTVSIGVAPNRYLAKLASKMRKPDGIKIIQGSELPEAMYELKLSDFTGVGRKMELRLYAEGIYSAEELMAADKATLHRVWGGVLGDRMYYQLRGVNVPDIVTDRKSLGHSHVLPPRSRRPEQAWTILCKLLHKAAERLRSYEMLAGEIALNLGYLEGGSWNPRVRIEETDSTLRLMETMLRIWKHRPNANAALIQVGCVLQRLVERVNHTPDLFTGSSVSRMERLDAALDDLRVRYGRDVVYLGNTHGQHCAAPMRISFTHIPDLNLESDVVADL